MLSKRQRLSRKDFSFVYKHGKRLNTPLYSLIYKDTNTKPQFSVVVSKKVSKSSVTRHILKRRFYGAIRDFLKKQPDFSQSVVVILHPQSAKEPYSVITQHIYTSFLSLI